MLRTTLASEQSVKLECVAWSEMTTPDEVANWNALAEQASEPNPFYESWYLLPSLKHLSGTTGVSILRARIDGQLIGLMPIFRPSRYYGLALPHLGNWQHPNIFCGAPLISKGLELIFWQALLGWADVNCNTAMFLHLRDIPLSSPLHHALIEVARIQSRQSEVVYHEQRAMIASKLSPDAYWETSVSAKKRKELRRQAKRLDDEGEIQVHRTTDASHVEDWCQDFLRLEIAGWKGRLGSALGCDDMTNALFCESLTSAASLGRLERLTMTLDGQPIAMLASFLTPPGAFSYKTTFDERFAKYSPGVLLQQANLEILSRPEIAWSDSCAAADHPMIDHIWRERRAIGRISIAIGGRARRFAFRQIVRLESRRSCGK